MHKTAAAPQTSRRSPGGNLMPRDVFPSTLLTWISHRQDEGATGRREINRHVMAVYGEPLLIYLRGHTLRWLGEPEELIDGFFANRLDREDFFAKWQASGLRLRRWLMNALNLYLMEVRRSRQQTARGRSAELDDEQWTGGDSPEKIVDRAFAQSIVRQALQQAQQRCKAKRLEEHWGVFMRHYYEGQKYDAFAGEYGVEPARAAIMARTATRVFRAALRNLLARDGTAPERIDEEIQALLEDIGS